jgi:hypothetical protein
MDDRFCAASGVQSRLKRRTPYFQYPAGIGRKLKNAEEPVRPHVIELTKEGAGLDDTQLKNPRFDLSLEPHSGRVSG